MFKKLCQHNAGSSYSFLQKVISTTKLCFVGDELGGGHECRGVEVKERTVDVSAGSTALCKTIKADSCLHS